MSYKIMGITAGRKNSNSEILLKAALMACEEQGADVTMINLRDFNILDCSGCTAYATSIIPTKDRRICFPSINPPQTRNFRLTRT